jgi:predicted membrane-bound spermidine synthase
VNPGFRRLGIRRQTAALLHPDPQDILIIGQGAGGTPIAAGVSQKTHNVRVVDIAAPVFDAMQEAARRSADDVLHRPLRQYYADPRYTRIVADARHLLLTEERRYDIIEADTVYPTSALAGQLYSTDFFRLALSRLKPGGYVVQWMPSERTLASFCGCSRTSSESILCWSAAPARSTSSISGSTRRWQALPANISREWAGTAMKWRRR